MRVNWGELLETWVRIAEVMQGASTGKVPGPETGVIRVAAVPAELIINVDSFFCCCGWLMIRVVCSCLMFSMEVFKQGCRNRVWV